MPTKIERWFDWFVKNGFTPAYTENNKVAFMLGEVEVVSISGSGGWVSDKEHEKLERKFRERKINTLVLLGAGFHRDNWIFYGDDENCPFQLGDSSFTSQKLV